MKKILILAGGYSKERDISLLTAKSVYKELKKNKNYKILVKEPNGSFATLGDFANASVAMRRAFAVASFALVNYY